MPRSKAPETVLLAITLLSTGVTVEDEKTMMSLEFPPTWAVPLLFSELFAMTQREAFRSIPFLRVSVYLVSRDRAACISAAAGANQNPL
jgi:hypothetical protein